MRVVYDPNFGILTIAFLPSEKDEAVNFVEGAINHYKEDGSDTSEVEKILHNYEAHCPTIN